MTRSCRRLIGMLFAYNFMRSYYRSFIPNISKIANPIIALTSLNGRRNVTNATITETSPWWLGNFRKFTLYNFLWAKFELIKKYFLRVFMFLKINVIYTKSLKKKITLIILNSIVTYIIDFLHYLNKPPFYYISGGLMRLFSHGVVSMMDFLKDSLTVIPLLPYPYPNKHNKSYTLYTDVSNGCIGAWLTQERGKSRLKYIMYFVCFSPAFIIYTLMKYRNISTK